MEADRSLLEVCPFGGGGLLCLAVDCVLTLAVSTAWKPGKLTVKEVVRSSAVVGG